MTNSGTSDFTLRLSSNAVVTGPLLQRLGHTGAKNNDKLNDNAIFIGGVGGSGTRAVAEITRSLGISVGENLNGSLDNLDWPAKECAALLRDKNVDFAEKHVKIGDAFQAFASRMRAFHPQNWQQNPTWATKVPGSFFYLEHLSQLFPNMKYIHVLRHGLDMAYSQNHNQLRNWGPFFEIEVANPATPWHLLKYWASANCHAQELCQTHLPQNHYWVKFEELCSDSEAQIERLANFLEVDVNRETVRKIGTKIVKQSSQDRYKSQASSDQFDSSDLATLEKFGYSADLN